jgi:Zn finger protein HypA/HybF involved in hydrogenase expression
MYIRQVLGALVGGLGAGYLGHAAGYSTVGVAAAVVVTYCLIRWAWATIQRTRYWIGRSSRDIHTEYCPNCNRDRYRLSGDWILQCRQCGWKSGPPVLRWLLYSVPAHQFQRSVSRLGAFAVGISTTVLIYAQPSSSAPGTVDVPAVSLSALPSAREVGLGILLGLTILLAILWVLRPRRYYCRNCGQDLGRGDPPAECPKCQSNRITTEDPGVGKKMRIEVKK